MALKQPHEDRKHFQDGPRESAASDADRNAISFA
jgi:hypothetical protein